MEIGLRLPHTGRHASADKLRMFAVTAEQLGFDGLWVADHVLAPVHCDTPYVLGPKPVAVADGVLIEKMGLNLEMCTTLAFVAAITSRVRLCSGVAVLPLRNPILLAKQLATIDHLSGGRLVCGVGAGWLRAEVEALGGHWRDRGRRMEEAIALMRRFWRTDAEAIDFHGEFWDVPMVSPEPKPAGWMPVLVGGHSDVAIDRAARVGDGWMSSIRSPRRLREDLERLRDRALLHGRDPDELLIYTAVQRGDDMSLADRLGELEELGVDHVRLDVSSLEGLQRIADQLDRSALRIASGDDRAGL